MASRESLYGSQRYANMTRRPLHAQYGKFAPDTMLITMYPKHALVDNDDRALSLDLRGTSYLFHEWIHYIHNVSTVHGASCFLTVVSYWNDFRFTMLRGNESQGSDVLDDGHKASLEKQQKLLATGRGPSGKTLPPGVRVKNCRVLCANAGAVDEDGIEASANLIVEVCRRRTRRSRRTKTYDIAFSATDLLESIAYMLEARFLWSLNRESPLKVAVDPYQTLFLIGRAIAPLLSKHEILICGIASLQWTAPVGKVLSLLKMCNEWKLSKVSIEASLAQMVTSHLKAERAVLDKWLMSIETMFPVDGPLARAVLEVLSYLRANLNHRRSAPFFELRLIEQLRAAGVVGFRACMSELMQLHGICSVEQVRHGPDDKVGRDVPLEFSVMSGDAVKTEGRRVMIASFEFAMGHLQDGGEIRKTLAMRSTKCPFYASCTLPERIEQPMVCKRTPWDSLKWNASSGCWYRAGAHQTRLLDAPIHAVG